MRPVSDSISLFGSMSRFLSELFFHFLRLENIEFSRCQCVLLFLHANRSYFFRRQALRKRSRPIRHWATPAVLPGRSTLRLPRAVLSLSSSTRSHDSSRHSLRGVLSLAHVTSIASPFWERVCRQLLRTKGMMGDETTLDRDGPWSGSNAHDSTFFVIN